MYKVYYNDSAFADGIIFVGSFNDSYEATMKLSEVLNGCKRMVVGIITKDGVPVQTFYNTHNTI